MLGFMLSGHCYPYTPCTDSFYNLMSLFWRRLPLAGVVSPPGSFTFCIGVPLSLVFKGFKRRLLLAIGYSCNLACGKRTEN